MAVTPAQQVILDRMAARRAARMVREKERLEAETNKVSSQAERNFTALRFKMPLTAVAVLSQRHNGSSIIAKHNAKVHEVANDIHDKLDAANQENARLRLKILDLENK
jgi:hypothetical protein